MASPACHRLSSLSRLTPDLPHLPHPRLTLLPFPPSQPDPLPISNYSPCFSLSPSSAVSNSPFVRKVFEDAVCACPVLDQELESPHNSAESSVSSCFFMSSNSDNDDADTGTSSSSSLSELASSSPPAGPLDSLTSLCAALPIKRGLSRYFSGKSQSFSSLAQVSSVTDLAKPENPYVKRRRMGMGVESLSKHHSYPPRCEGISKRRTTSSLRKGLESLPLVENASLDGHAKPRPAKCFSVPEF